MTASVRKMSVLDSKHTNNVNFLYRGTGVVSLSEISSKERSAFKSKTTLTSQRVSLTSEISELSTAVFELDLGEDDEMLVCSEEWSPVLKKVEALLETITTVEKQVENDVKYLVLRHTNRQSRSESFPSKRDSTYNQTDLAMDLKTLGYDVQIRQSIGRGTGVDGVTNLSHSFIRCTPPNSDCVFVLDTKFREQFDIAHKTRCYEKTLEFLPKLLVLQEDRINPLVKLLCEESAQSFRDSGFPLPPWRRIESLLSKWYPRKSVDTPIQMPVHHKESIIPVGIHDIDEASRFDRELSKSVGVQAR
eukprot:g8315.t1